MRKEEEDLYMLRGMISSMSQDKQEKIKSVAERIQFMEENDEQR